MTSPKKKQEVKPNPGSDEAVDAGCTCPQMDNAYGKGGYRGFFFISHKCPLHGKS